MLASKFRLTGAQNFKRVQQEGLVLQSANFGLAYLKRKDQETSRFGFVVSTKIARDAVDRNRIKRIIREAVRVSSIDIVNGYDVVFLAKTTIMRVPTASVMQEVKNTLRQVGVLK